MGVTIPLWPPSKKIEKLSSGFSPEGPMAGDLSKPFQGNYLCFVNPRV